MGHRARRAERDLAIANEQLREADHKKDAFLATLSHELRNPVYFDAGVRYYDRPAAAERTGTRRLAMLRQYFTLAPVTVQGRIVYRETPLNGPVKTGDLILVRLTVAGSADWRYLRPATRRPCPHRPKPAGQPPSSGPSTA